MLNLFNCPLGLGLPPTPNKPRTRTKTKIVLFYSNLEAPESRRFPCPAGEPPAHPTRPPGPPSYSVSSWNDRPVGEGDPRFQASEKPPNQPPPVSFLPFPRLHPRLLRPSPTLLLLVSISSSFLPLSLSSLLRVCVCFVLPTLPSPSFPFAFLPPPAGFSPHPGVLPSPSSIPFLLRS